MGVPEDRDAAFVAKITAGATHEIRNVLAIIKESAGLVTDVIHSLGGRPLSNPDKVVRAVGRIDAQVSRGAALLAEARRSLFRASPTADQAEGAPDPNPSSSIRGATPTRRSKYAS